MASLPRYTTYQPGELEETLRRLARISHVAQSVPSPIGSLTNPVQGNRSHTGLLLRHSCTVTFPDGTSGTCLYTRSGPVWHLFKYEHTGADGKTVTLPVVNDQRRIANAAEAIEEIAKQRAEAAFWEAVSRERREYFQRAAEPSDGTRKTKPERSQMKAARAKELSGKYALCRKVGKSGIPVSDYFDDLKTAVTAWEEQTDHNLVIACCNRLDRCWEEPRFNPLHGNPNYPHAIPCPEEKESKIPFSTVRDETQAEVIAVEENELAPESAWEHAAAETDEDDLDNDFDEDWNDSQDGGESIDATSVEGEEE